MLKKPKAFSTTTTTRMTITTFKIVLIEAAIGMYALTSQSPTPMTIRKSTSWMIDIENPDTQSSRGPGSGLSHFAHRGSGGR